MMYWTRRDNRVVSAAAASSSSRVVNSRMSSGTSASESSRAFSGSSGIRIFKPTMFWGSIVENSPSESAANATSTSMGSESVVVMSKGRVTIMGRTGESRGSSAGR